MLSFTEIEQLSTHVLKLLHQIEVPLHLSKLFFLLLFSESLFLLESSLLGLESLLLLFGEFLLFFGLLFGIFFWSVLLYFLWWLFFHWVIFFLILFAYVI